MAFKLRMLWVDKDTNTATCSVGIVASDINAALAAGLPIAGAMQDISDCALLSITAGVKHTTNATANDSAITSDCARYLIIVTQKLSGRMGLLYIPSPDMSLFTLPATYPVITEINNPLIVALSSCIVGSIDDTGDEITAIVACGLAY